MENQELFAIDSLGNKILVGDYVLAHVRFYQGSASARKMIKAQVREFINDGKVRVTPENKADIEWYPERSWVSQHHLTLLAPRDMAHEYRDNFNYHLEERV